jgi:hypothetical protein
VRPFCHGKFFYALVELPISLITPIHSGQAAIGMEAGPVESVHSVWIESALYYLIESSSSALTYRDAVCLMELQSA